MTFSRYSGRLRAGAFASEPCWLPRSRLIALTPPREIRDWLFDADSLTRRVKARCRQCFQVRVLSQRRERPMFNERRLLALPDHARALVRQVHLMCGDHPWVFGRTVIPLETLSGPRRRLAFLGDKSLGATLFANSSLRRFEVQVARVSPGHDLYEAATRDLPVRPEVIWGRRSVFHLNDKPLLVSEVFLPRLFAADHV